ncbi:MAG: type II toxin-antitoxin system YafQ family toxin [Parcubacteria group bacterium CG10_big_fil_rev_8_21_14_0_10_41_35]|nr:MAG: type II toxin-antitoxin system YafQ family toxin [Parcubacteria group bacterium CG10_big_fil_rev_8_21_14_0_10_41_35]
MSPFANNHALSGDRQPYRSINITGDYRLIYEQYDEDTVRLIDIDTHSNLY